MLKVIKNTIDPGGKRDRLKVFVVHGHDEELIRELREYLQNVFGLREPILLREVASAGMTIIEKFEKISTDVDLVFVLLTPDDVVDVGGSQVRRARQNVIFELGYFYGRLTRKNGRVLAMVGRNVELPSDIHGVVYIDISNGLRAADPIIRRELKHFL